jgi:hypothetical protein
VEPPIDVLVGRHQADAPDYKKQEGAPALEKHLEARAELGQKKG